VPVNADSRTIVVPDDYPTVTQAIENAADGDMIFIKKGTHDGPTNQTLVINKAVALYGEDKDTTILNLSPPLVPMTLFTLHYMGFLAAIKVNSDNVKISGLTIRAPGGGISVTGSQIQITNIIATTGLSIKCSWATISQNTLEDGLDVIGNSNMITFNLLKNALSFDCVGAYNVIANNTMVEDDETKIVKLTVKGTHNAVSNNTLSSIELQGDNNSVSNNRLKVPPGYFGVYLSKSSGNTICKNWINYESLKYQQDGIGITDSHDNVIYMNHIEGVHNGIYLDDSPAIPEATYNNTIYHNNLIRNQFQAWVGRVEPTANSFDNGKEGNYWSDYDGADADGDGIGDTPYIIDDNNMDRYPLMEPFAIQEFYERLNNIPEFPDGTGGNVTGETEPPPTTLLIASVVTVLAVVGLGLLVYHKKRKSEAAEA
jgi:nitrous oxidase accessory protein NosD